MLGKIFNATAPACFRSSLSAKAYHEQEIKDSAPRFNYFVVPLWDAGFRAVGTFAFPQADFLC